jgi:hypothetical protein
MANPFSLIELDAEYAELVRQIEEQGGEVSPDQERSLDTYVGRMVAKADYYINVTNMINAGDDYCDQMIAKFRAKKLSIERERERWERAMIQHLDNMGINCQEGELGKVRIAQSESVECDIDALPISYKRTKTIVEPDKKAIKEAWKNGVEVAGATKNVKRYIRVY